MNTKMAGCLLAPSFWEQLADGTATPASVALLCIVAAAALAAVVMLILLLIPFRLTLHMGDGRVLKERHFGMQGVELHEPAPRDGYEFKGWFEDEALTKPVKKIFRMPMRGAVLYAGWEPKQEEALFEEAKAAVADTLAVLPAADEKPNAAEGEELPPAPQDTAEEGSALPGQATPPVEEIPAEEEAPVREEIPAAESVAQEEIAEEEPAEDAQEEAAEGDEIEGALVTPVTGGKVFVQYRRSYTARLIQSEEKTKDLFNAIRSEMLSYIGVKERVSWNYLSFNVGRKQFAKLNANTKSLIVYFALDPAEVDAKYNFRDVSEKKRYSAVPVRYKITGSRSFQYALGLLEQTAAKFGLDFRRRDEKLDIPYEERDALIRRGLIKVYARRDTGETVTEQQLEQMIAEGAKVEKLSAFTVTDSVNVNEADVLINDATAKQLIALAETKDARVAPGRRTYVNLDTISANFAEGDTVDLASLKEKGLIDKKASACKILARGTLDKSLTVEATDFSLPAVKMIALTGGKVVRIRRDQG